jgi:glycosyltransferase involved in cell wall biosynthesis
MSLRCLWVIKGLGRGGAEQLLLSAATVTTGGVAYEAAFVRSERNALVAPLRDLGVPVHDLAAGKGLWPVRLARLVRDERFDVVHVHSPLLAAVARLAIRAQRRRPSLVTTEHNVWPAYGAATRAANAVTFPLDDAHLAVSEEVRRSIPGRWRDRVEVVRHGVDLATVAAARSQRDGARRDLGVGHEHVVVLTVANYRRHKAWPDLLAAARRVVDADDRVRFVGAGQGPLDAEVEAEHARHDLGERFLLLGGRDDVPRLLAGADVFCLSSLQEGLPVALMEALAAGVPVVATAVGGVPEAVTDGVEGRLVPPSRPDLLAAALLEVTGDGEARARMAAAALVRARDFDIRRAVERTEALYRELAARRAA